MLGSHSQIYTHPEPHLVQPLYYAGYFDRVDAAPYDHINASEAMREFVQALPSGEADYVEACRAYLELLYGRMLEPTGRRYFLDKTPANSLVAPFIEKVFPQARYVVLTRHPLAVFSSYAESFFEGDYAAAFEFNPLLVRYVPALARFLEETRTRHVHVRYEDLVSEPEARMRDILDMLDLPFEDGVIAYGEQAHESKSYGDPKVTEHARPVTASVERWASVLAADEAKRDVSLKALENVPREDVEAWGYRPDDLLEPLERAGAPPPSGRAWRMGSYRFKRKVLMGLRRSPAAGRMASRMRYFADVILRDSL
jgi:hypothetical protein